MLGTAGSPGSLGPQGGLKQGGGPPPCGLERLPNQLHAGWAGGRTGGQENPEGCSLVGDRWGDAKAAEQGSWWGGSDSPMIR